jgi:hypothetical protein
MALQSIVGKAMDPRDRHSVMARPRSVSSLVAASVLLVGLFGVGLWHWSTPSLKGSTGRLEWTRPPVESEQNAAEPLPTVEVRASQSVEQTHEAGSGVSAPVQRTKAAALSQVLEQRPPALVDRQTELRSDPERKHRYAARAARAERLNQRLAQHIDALEERLATAHSAEHSAIEAELSQLRANLAKRRDLERAALPTPATRTGS